MKVNKNPNITLSSLKNLLKYNHVNGVFTWLVKTSSRAMPGYECGYLTPAGYRRIKIKGHEVFAHRLAFFYMTGKWPNDEVDHINGIPSDNRFVNLRLCTHRQNLFNQKMKSNNSSGIKGVSFDLTRSMWRSRLTVNGYEKHLGYFSSKQKAVFVVSSERTKAHGEFARAA